MSQRFVLPLQLIYVTVDAEPFSKLEAWFESAEHNVGSQHAWYEIKPGLHHLTSSGESATNRVCITLQVVVKVPQTEFASPALVVVQTGFASPY